MWPLPLRARHGLRRRRRHVPQVEHEREQRPVRVLRMRARRRPHLVPPGNPQHGLALRKWVEFPTASLPGLLV